MALRSSLLVQSALIFLHDPLDVLLISCGSRSIDARRRSPVASFSSAWRLYFVASYNRNPAGRRLQSRTLAADGRAAGARR